MFFKIATLAITLLLLVIGYALLAIAHDADERAERMYEEWKESKGADDEDSV